MKLRNIFSTMLFGALALVGCTDEYKTSSLEEFKLDKTFVSLPVAGGEVSVAYTATGDWSFDKIFKVNKLDENGNKIKDENGKYVMDDVALPAWLEVTPLQGGAGEGKLTFKAEKTDAGRETSLVISVGGKKQNLIVRQGEVVATEATCADVIAGPDGKTFIVEGVCTTIENDLYGNWWLEDKTGSILIYGTLDNNGQSKNFAKLGIEVGDIVKVKGPKTTYGAKIELVDVTVLKITKSLLKTTTPTLAVPAEGGEVLAKFVVKGNGLTFEMSDDVKNWASIVKFETIKAKDSDNPDTTAVRINVQPNTERGAREGGIRFNSSANKASTDVNVTLIQEGNVPPTIAEVIAEKKASVKACGTITAFCTQGFILTDASASVLVYNKKDSSTEFKIGDEVEVVGSSDIYNFGGQIGNVTSVTKIGEGTYTYPAPEVLTGEGLDAFVATLKGKDKVADRLVDVKYVSLTGTVAVSGKYTNFNIPGATTASGSLYNPLASLNMASYDGKEVTLEGYITSVSVSGDTPKFVNLVVTAVKSASEGGNEGGNEGGTGSYVKVTSELSDYSGTYLIVDDERSIALDGSLAKVDAAANYAAVTSANGTIASSADVDKMAVTIAKMDGGYSIKVSGNAGKPYIGSTGANKNEIQGEATEIANAISFSEGHVVIAGTGASISILAFNGAASNGDRFRYYKNTTIDKDPATYRYVSLYKLQ